MSYILDALKRNASDAQVGQAPALHTQPVVSPKGRASWIWPIAAMASLALAVLFAGTLQPWNRVAPTPKQISPAVASLVQVRGEVDYHQYPKRSPVAVTEVAPKPQVHELPLPQEPVSAGVVESRDEILEANQRLEAESDKVQGSQLEALFAQAVAESSQEHQELPGHFDASRAQPLTQLPQAFQDQVPSLNFSAHSYVSDSRKRLVKVNGKELREGDWITEQLQLRAILPSKVVLQMEGQPFSLPALADW